MMQRFPSHAQSAAGAAGYVSTGGEGTDISTPMSKASFAVPLAAAARCALRRLPTTAHATAQLLDPEQHDTPAPTIARAGRPRRVALDPRPRLVPRARREGRRRR